MAEQENSALSQQEIDALLSGGVPDGDDDDEVDEENGRVTGLVLEDDAELDESGDEPPGEIEDERPEPAPSGREAEPIRASNVPGIETQIARAVESAVKSMTGDLSALAKRLAKAENELRKVADLERQIQSLKTPRDNQKEIEVLRQKVAALESGVRNTPVFNLYEKMTCPSCGTHGAGQVKTRCGSCGKEGWFGRRAPIEEPAARTPVTPAPRQPAVSKPVGKTVKSAQPRNPKRAA